MADTATDTLTPEIAPPASAAAPPGALPDWRASLPEPLRAEKSLETFKDVGALAQSYVETKRLVGQRAGVPGPNAKPEEVAAYRAALGIPDSPAGYTISRPEIALQSWDAAAEQDFLATAHRAGMPPGHVQEILNWYGKYEAGRLRAAQAQAEQTMTALRQEYGPNYDANLGRANRVVQEFGGEELVSYLAKTGLGRHPAMVKTFVKLAQAMVESGAMETSGDSGTSVEEAKAELAAIYADKQHPYNVAGSPGWQEAADHVLALRRIALSGENRKLVEYR